MIPIQLPLFLSAACDTGQSLFPDLYEDLRGGSCEVVIDSFADIITLLGNIISIMLIIAGFVAVGFIIVGGFKYITSSGDPSGIKSAKETIVNAIIGLVLAMVSFGVVKYVAGSF